MRSRPTKAGRCTALPPFSRPKFQWLRDGEGAMKLQEREQARTLRTEGWSIKEIAKTLRVAVGSVSVWVSDIALTEDQIERLEKKQKKSRDYILGRARKLRLAAAINHEKWK